MKNFENLGQILNKAQQKKILGGYNEGCNCLICYWSDGGVGTYASDCYSSHTVAECDFLGAPDGNYADSATYGIC